MSCPCLRCYKVLWGLAQNVHLGRVLSQFRCVFQIGFWSTQFVGTLFGHFSFPHAQGRSTNRLSGNLGFTANILCLSRCLPEKKRTYLFGLMEPQVTCEYIYIYFCYTVSQYLYIYIYITILNGLAKGKSTGNLWFEVPLMLPSKNLWEEQGCNNRLKSSRQPVAGWRRIPMDVWV